MNHSFAGGFVVSAFTFLFSQGTGAAEAPNLSKLAETGRRTLERVGNTPATWTTRCRVSDDGYVDIKVFRDNRRQSWSFRESGHGSPRKLCDIIEVDGLWHVMARGQALKCRPYEAELRFPAAYLFLALADLRAFPEKNPLGALDFEKRDANRLSFRLRPTGESRRILEKVLAESKRFNAGDLPVEQRRRQEETVARAREQLTNGTPVVFDEPTGILLEGKNQTISFSIEGFRWLDRLPEDVFALPQGVRWDDQTRPWSAKDYEHCVMVARDPLFVPGNAPLSLDAFTLNLKSGDLRRIPFVGITSMAGFFVESRTVAVVGGMDLNGQAGIVRIDLASGKNEPFASDWLSGGPLLTEEVSPDGQYALSFRPSFSDTELEIQLIKLNDQSVRTLRKGGRLGLPSSWLPESDGIIVKRFEPVSDAKEIELRVLCRLGLDGTLKDLRPGDSPLVLRKSRRILYQENGSRLWHTCDLDGSNPKLYADGLAGHGQPAVSPDEHQILFTRFNKGRGPQLMLFELGKSNGVLATPAPGYTGKPVWR